MELDGSNRQEIRHQRDAVDECIHRPPSENGLDRLRHLVLTRGLAADVTGHCHYRNYVWTILLQVPISEHTTHHYARLLIKGPTWCHEKIMNDHFRTLASSRDFKSRVTNEALARVLSAYVAETGKEYVQGMNVLAAPFLYVSRSESQAYALFSALVQKHCPLYVSSNLKGVKRGVDLVNLVLSIVDYELFSHLAKCNVSPQVYAFASTMTLCVCTPPLSEALYLWDKLLSYGVHLNIIFIVAQLLQRRTEILSTKNPMSLLRSFAPLQGRRILDESLALVRRLQPPVWKLLIQHAVDPSPHVDELIVLYLSRASAKT